MTTYTKTVNNRVNCFAPRSDTWSSSTAWPAMVWGGLWGEGSAGIEKIIFKVISDAEAVTSVVKDFSFFRYITNAVGSDSTQFKIAFKALANTAAVSQLSSSKLAIKDITNSEPATSAAGEFVVIKDLNNQITEASTQEKYFLKVIDNSAPVAGDMTEEFIIDSQGFYTVFDGRSTNAEQRVFTSYATGSFADSTWTAASVTSTVWS